MKPYTKLRILNSIFDRSTVNEVVNQSYHQTPSNDIAHSNGHEIGPKAGPG